MVAHLTGTGNGPLHVARMPRTDASNFPETLVRLAWQLLGSPTGSNAVEAVALCDSDTVDHLVLLEDGADLDRLLEQTVGEFNLVRNAAAVDLDLHQVCLLLLQWSLADLRVGKNADNGAVFLDALEFTGDGLALVLGVLLGVLGECLLLALVPVLVESSLDLIVQMLGPDRCQ